MGESRVVYLQCEALQADQFDGIVPQWLAIDAGSAWVMRAASLAILVKEQGLRDASLDVELVAVSKTAAGDDVRVRQARLLVDGDGCFAIRANEKNTWAEFSTQAMPIEPFIEQVEAGEQFFGDDGFEAFVRESFEEPEEMSA